MKSIAKVTLAQILSGLWKEGHKCRPGHGNLCGGSHSESSLEGVKLPPQCLKYVDPKCV